MSDVAVPPAAPVPVLPSGAPTAPPRERRRRRPSGAPPALPHHIHRSGLGWLVSLIATLVVALAIFAGGLHGAAIPVTVADDTVVRWVSSWEAPGLFKAARMAMALGSWWSIEVVSAALPLALIALRRWRHLLVAEIVIQLALLTRSAMYELSTRPRPFGVSLRGGWGGWSLPSEQMLATTGLLVIALYTLVPDGRWRNLGKWLVTVLVALVAFARVYLGVEAPTDIALAVVIGVALPLVAFRMFLPNEYFPVAYKRGRRAHLDVGGARGVAIKQALEEQLGVTVTEIRPVGLAGSAGSTPLRLRLDGSPPQFLFGKLYSKAHLRADRWYKLGRELLYGRLEDEKPFNAVRRLVQQEDYAMRLVRDAGVRSATPFGFVELTPEREYLLVTEFFDGAVELGEATVDDALIDDALHVIRQLWNAGLAHRDIKPANIMVRDGEVLLIDVAFAEVRPTPWRQAVDLANMMLCLALRSDAQRVYDRALLQFSVDEISEGLAAARGLALPSQLRRALHAESRDLHTELLHLLPQRPRPIKVQRWSPRRVLIWIALLGVITLLAFNFTSLFTDDEATRAPLGGATVDCADTNKLEPMWLQAQSVQSAALVPCVRSLPVGWSFQQAFANSGRSIMVIDHDRAGRSALEVTLTKQCDPGDATEVFTGASSARRFAADAPVGSPDRTWYDVFPGGCTTIRLHSDSSVPAVNAEVTRQAPAIVGYFTREELADALSERTDGRLHLDPS